MTQTLPISKIWFDRASRQRRDLGNLDDLKHSIQSVGLINPIVVTREGQLIAGERRLTTCTELGWTAIPVTYLEDMTPEQLELVELDENIRRLDLPWQDRALAVARFAGLKPKGTAEALGLPETTYSAWLRVGRALKEGDTTVAECLNFSTANNLLERREARKKEAEVDSVDSFLTKAKVTAAPSPSAEAPTEPAKPVNNSPIEQADFVEWAKSYSGPKFNLLHCDFPYGVNASNMDSSAAGKFDGKYEDTPEVYDNLCATLADFTKNHVAEAAHMLFWYSPTMRGITLERLTAMGWKVSPYDLIWHRSDNKGILPDHRRGPRQVYETCMFCTRGDRFIVRAVSNLISSPTVKDFHMSEKPKPVLEHFLRMLVDESTRLLDPTAGSGNALVVGDSLGAAQVRGLEINPTNVLEAQRNWKEYSND